MADVCFQRTQEEIILTDPSHRSPPLPIAYCNSKTCRTTRNSASSRDSQQLGNYAFFRASVSTTHMPGYALERNTGRSDLERRGQVQPTWYHETKPTPVLSDTVRWQTLTPLAALPRQREMFTGTRLCSVSPRSPIQNSKDFRSFG